MHRTSAVAAVILPLLVVFLLQACESSSRAAQLIEQNKCRDCHTLKGKGGAVGPNLTTIGAKRSREYILEQLRAPKSHNPNTDMPSFGHLPAEDLNVMADYLSRLK